MNHFLSCKNYLNYFIFPKLDDILIGNSFIFSAMLKSFNKSWLKVSNSAKNALILSEPFFKLRIFLF